MISLETGLVAIAAPDYATFALVSLDDMKSHVRVDSDDEDALIQGYTYTAVEDIEDTSRRAIATQRWTLTLNRFPSIVCGDAAGDVIRLPKPPLTSVDAIRYVSTAGETVTLATDQYAVDISTLPGKIVPAYGVCWPVTRVQPRAVEIDFTCGFANAAAVPFKVKAAVQLYAADLYRNRESQITGTIVTQNQTVMRLLSKFLYREFR